LKYYRNKIILKIETNGFYYKCKPKTLK